MPGGQIGTGPSGYGAYGNRGNPQKTCGFPPFPQAHGTLAAGKTDLNLGWPAHLPAHLKRWETKCGSYLTEAIHFGNDVYPSVAALRLPDALRRNRWCLSVGISGGIRRNTQKESSPGTPVWSQRNSQDLWISVPR